MATWVPPLSMLFIRRFSIQFTQSFKMRFAKEDMESPSTNFDFCGLKSSTLCTAHLTLQSPLFLGQSTPMFWTQLSTVVLTGPKVSPILASPYWARTNPACSRNRTYWSWSRISFKIVTTEKSLLKSMTLVSSKFRTNCCLVCISILQILKMTKS